MESAASTPFKYHYLDKNGNATGFLAKKGEVTADCITFDDRMIEMSKVGAAVRRFDVVALTLGENEEDADTIAFKVTGAKPTSVAQAINRHSSALRVAKREQELHEKNLGHEFRSDLCPACGATIDLSVHPPSPQMYCQYCDTFSTMAGDGHGDEKHFHHCDSCSLYARPADFTIFYFYFLVVVYGWSSRRVNACHTCMRGETWKMLFGNLLGLLGEFWAIPQFIRARMGGSKRTPAWRELDKANKHTIANQIERAAPLYEAIAERGYPCAGVRYNHAIGLMMRKAWEPAAGVLELALADCSNYADAARALAACYHELGRQEDVEAVLAEWNDGEIPIEDIAPAADAPAAPAPPVVPPTDAPPREG